MPVVIEGSKGVNGGAAEFKSFTFGVVGDRRNIRATIPDGSTSAVFSGDRHILSDGSGNQVLVSNFSLTLNTLLSGVGGMAQGQPVVASGNIAVWHIFNPTNNSQALIATDCTGIKVQEVLEQDLLPAGYTFSALLAVLLVKPDKTLLPSVVVDRKVYIATTLLFTTGVGSSPSGLVTPISLSGKYPENCKELGVILVGTSGPAQQLAVQLLVGSSIASGVVSEVNAQAYCGANGSVKSQDLIPRSSGDGYVLIVTCSSPINAHIYANSYSI